MKTFISLPIGGGFSACPPISAPTLYRLGSLFKLLGSANVLVYAGLVGLWPLVATYANWKVYNLLFNKTPERCKCWTALTDPGQIKCL